MSKVGILVHPFWCGVSSEVMIDKYTENLEEYDRLVVFLPVIKSITKRRLIKVLGSDLLDLLFNKPMDEDHKDMLLSLVNNEVYKVKYYLERLGMMRSKFNNDYNTKLTTEALYNKLKEDPLTYIKDINPDIFHSFMYGDMSSFKRVRKSLKQLRKRLSGYDVKYLHLGGTGLIHFSLLSAEDYFRKIFNNDNENYIFGEYHNMCVDTVKNSLEEILGLNSTKVSSRSVYLATSVNDVLPVEEQEQFGCYTNSINERIFCY